MDNDGNRILAKYYDKNILSTLKEQKAFEKNLFNKTHRSNTEIIMLDGLTCVYKSNVDLFFYVMGNAYENELILLSVLNCLYDSISLILKKNVEKRLVLENLEIIMLAFDEICDGGWVVVAKIWPTYLYNIPIVALSWMLIHRRWLNVSICATKTYPLPNRQLLR